MTNTPQTEGENKMKYVAVRYLSSSRSQLYDYQAIEGVEIGDVVVVPTRFGVSLAQVMEVRDESSVQAALTVSHIISDSSDVFKKLRDDVQRKSLKEQIESRITEIVKTAQYDEYAKVDPVMKKLVDKLKSIE